MAYALVVNTAVGGSATTSSIDTTGCNLITVFVSYDEASAAGSLTDSKSNTWTGLTADDAGGGPPDDTWGRWYYCFNPTVGSGHTFTSAISYGAICVQGWSGATTSPFDVQNATGANNRNVTSLSAGSVTPSEDNCLVLWGLSAGGDAASMDLAGGSTAIDAIDSNTGVHYGAAVEYVVQTTATAANPTWGWTNNATATSRVAVFKSTADATDPELDTAEIPAHGASVELTFDESVTGVNEQDYNVDVEGFPMGLADQTGSGASWELPFSVRWVRDGETATLDYTGSGTVDGAANALQPISAMAVTNNSIITDKMVRYVGRKLGLMVCFNINTFLDLEYSGGATFPDDFGDPDDFAPTEDLADCVDQWVLCAKRMGAQYIVLTTKHHDGFKLWPSAHGYNLTESSWYAGAGSPDLVDLFTTKCRAAGLGVGLYYSIWDKYFEATAPGGTYTAWTVAELTELLSNYGAIDFLWFDGWNWLDDEGVSQGAGDPDFTDVVLATVQSTVTSLQPDCAFVVNWHKCMSDPEGSFTASDICVFEGGVAGQATPSGNDWPAEDVDTIRTDNDWFWNTAADNPLSLATLLAALAQANGRRGSYLLDVPPDTSGMIPDQEFRRAAELGMSTLEPTLNVASEGAAGGGLVGLQSIESGVIG